MASSMRELLQTGELILAPGAYDCLTAGAIARAGFKAAYMTGAGVAASHGFPDFGLLTMTEMVAVAGRVARSLSIPLIADGDTGFGNELNAARAVREYERAGVGAMHIEDQVFPKQCGHFDNKAIVPAGEFIAKIRAAAMARETGNFVLIARTDARSVEGLDAAIDRANRALEAGADVAFVEAPQDLDEMAAIPRRVQGPCLLNIVWRGKTPDVSFEDAASMGYRIAILPSILLKSVMGISDEVLQAARLTGRHPVPPGDIGIQDGAVRAGGEEWKRLRACAP
ncbi:isocitrate lyase/PEP mutase family protein [Phreatobacter stygius]|uniref:Isocitrate lyase/PEP mutase family protein n=1 Tax=Phreatobacter stygius TaxID=1940610 RepID=A0A4D7AYA6_9HYPH|nr:isocitrate lyase/PEP mutase family protein [Phreatobacter stygius]QCI64405.1 isocitrate lyase/PEP mutase family protein [Phreatobacter stygius]